MIWTFELKCDRTPQDSGIDFIKAGWVLKMNRSAKGRM